MDVPAEQVDQVKYTTPSWVQAWFLKRSRALWRRKYKTLKVENKRLQNRVNDVSKSREKWCEETKKLRKRVRELEAQQAALLTAASKKDGLGAGSG